MSSTNMGMPIPVVGTTVGPTWANNYNSCLTIVDSHDHTTGNGVQITPSGLNINSDLSFQSTSSATNLYKATFASQSSAFTGTNFLSFISGNLYVNDGSGNQIAITSGGGVAGSPGSIGSLASPASATYSAGSKLFSWRADSGKAAAMDNGAVTIRETNVASAKGITLQSPTSLGADYSLTLLTALPGSTQAINCDSSGNLGTISYDNIGAGMTSTGANAVAATRTRATGTSVAAGGVAISSSTSNFATSSTSYVDVTNASVTIVTSGRPVFIGLVPDGSANPSYVQLDSGSPSLGGFKIVRDSTDIALSTMNTNSAPPGCVSAIDAASAASHVYKLQAKGSTGGLFASVFYCKLVAYEL